MNRTTDPSELPEVLGWLRDVLWPPSSGHAARLARTPARDGERRWLPLPNAIHPTLLVPSGPRSAAAALRQFNDGMTQPARVRKGLLAVVVRLGGSSLARGPRLLVSEPRHEGWEDLVEATLPRIRGVPRVEVGISVGRQLRPNLKPVLEVSTPEGEVLAYAKIGWNAITKSLVEREADALEAYRAAKPRTFAVPSLIHRGSWNGLGLTVVSPGPQRLLRRGRSFSLPEARVVREVAEVIGEVDGGTVGASTYWLRLAERIRRVCRDRPEDGSLAWMSEVVESRFGDIRLRFGSSHGDFTPWNMTSTGERPFIWDWERWDRPAPVGIDAIHFGFEVGILKERLSVAEASRRAVARSASLLRSIGMGSRQVEAVRALQLVERAVRMEEGRREGLSVDEEIVGGLTNELMEAHP